MRDFFSSDFKVYRKIISGCFNEILKRHNDRVSFAEFSHKLSADIVKTVKILSVFVFSCCGKGNVMGAFLGAILMGAITNAMTLMRIQSEWQFLVKGLIIIGAVAIGAISERMSIRKAVRQKEAETKGAA